MFTVELTVRPRDGVRDPQGDAVQQALRGMGYGSVVVHGVGRTLRLDIGASNAAEARQVVEDMCRRLLVNPNLETYDVHVTPRPNG